MYNVNDVVMYGAFGICKITAVEKRNFTGEKQEYYVLKHIYSNKNVFYVPTNNEIALSKIHPICSKEEVDMLISCMNTEDLIWIDDDIKRKEEYSRIIRDGKKPEIILLIKTLYLRRQELSKCGRKLRSLDENYLSLAENMLFEELSYALGIEKDKVIGYIEEHLQ
ncbi:MAG: transcriptional regulator [Clostridia bacterium]|nr:transcriptional regulator [Clostridia bacterium]